MASPFVPGTDLPITSTTNPHALHFPAKDDLAHTKSMNEVIHNAKSATDKEHKMTLWQGIKLYPKAVGWSLLISTCIAMEGYDVCLLSSFCECFLPCLFWSRAGTVMVYRTLVKERGVKVESRKWKWKKFQGRRWRGSVKRRD
jgi:hypothetical protein